MTRTMTEIRRKAVCAIDKRKMKELREEVGVTKGFRRKLITKVSDEESGCTHSGG